MAKLVVLSREISDMLNKLSQEQLEQLVVDARNVSVAKAKSKQAESFNKLKDSGELKQMKEEFKACKAAAKGLTKTEFQLVIPINFHIKSSLYLGVLPSAASDGELSKFASWETNNGDYLFEQSMEGTIAKDSKLTHVQLKILKPVVEEYIFEACIDIFDLAPQELKDSFNEVKKRLVTLYTEAQKYGLEFDDLS